MMVANFRRKFRSFVEKPEAEKSGAAISSSQSLKQKKRPLRDMPEEHIRAALFETWPF
jgi:hypothetical protein